MQRTLCNKWARFLAFIPVSIGILSIFPSKDLAPVPAQKERITASASSHPSGTASLIHADFVKVLADDREWQRNVLRFVDRMTGEEAVSFFTAPAGQPVSADVHAVQVTADNARPTVMRVNLGLLSETGANQLEIAIGNFEYTTRLRDKDENVEFYAPLAKGNPSVLLTLKDQGFFSDSTVATGEFSLRSWIENKDQTVSLPATAKDDHAVTAAVHVELVQPENTGDPLNIQHAPKELEASSSGRIDFTDEILPWQVGHDLLINSTERYAAIIISSDSPLAGDVRIYRLDSRSQIGTYASETPLVGAIVDRHAPMLVRVNGARSQALKYRIIGITDESDPSAGLIVWYAGAFAANTKSGGVPSSTSLVRKTMVWLKDAFDVRLTENDVNAIEDPLVRQTAGTLMQAESTASAQTGDKR